MAIYIGIPKPAVKPELLTKRVDRNTDVQNNKPYAAEESVQEPEQVLKVMKRHGVTDDEAVNLKQVLDLLKVSKSTFYGLIRSGLVCSGRKFRGRKLRYWRKSAIESFRQKYQSFLDESDDANTK